MNQKEIGPKEIVEWLDNQSGFTLEMKVLSYALSLGLESEHGGTYSDPVTDKPRQFDIRCTARNKNMAIKLAIECKALSKEFPLVIQRVPRRKKESFHDVFYTYEPDVSPAGIRDIFGGSEIFRTITESPLYPIDKPVGKACNQIGKRNNKLFANDSEIYDKWAQAISSVYDLIADSVNEREKIDFDGALTVVFPVLVVPDGCLWCVDYDSKGDRLSEPKPRNEVEFYISKDYWRRGQTYAVYTVSHLQIVTFSGYKCFSKKVASKSKFWEWVFPIENLKEIE